jgi:hypothetical protein
LMTHGTEIVHVPDNFPKPADKSWSDDLAEMAEDLTIPESGRKRYYCWLKWIVLASTDDFSKLLRKLNEVGGVTREEDVQEAAESFRDNETRAADLGVSSEAAAGNGDISPAGVSGAGS